MTKRARPTGAASEPEAAVSLRWWDLACALILAVMLAVELLDLLGSSSPSASAHVRPLLALAAFALCYATAGRPALVREKRNEPQRPADWVLLAVLIIVTGVAAATNPSFATLQAFAYPLIWNVCRRYGHAVAWSGALAAAIAVGYLAAAFERGALLGSIGTALAVAGLSFVFAAAMGTWITSIFERGEQHRLLADRLREAQAEVAALSEAAGGAAERERLSRELHDTLAQTLTGLVMLNEQAERALGSGDTARAKDRLARVGEASRMAMAEARALVAVTRPLGDGGLAPALERVAARLRADTELRVHCELDPPPLGREVEVVLLRAAQEGLANARRHARAAEVTVRLHREGGAAVLLVEDDGVGPEGAESGAVGSGTGGGFGLDGLRERAALVGGEVRFGPATGRGSRLEVRVPLDGGLGAPHDDEGGPR